MKNRTFSFINIFGLSVGLATCFLLILYIFDETSYDKHHQDPEQLYRIALESKGEKWAALPAPAAQSLKADFAEVEQVTRVLNFPNVERFLLKDENSDVQFYETGGYYVDSTFFKVFTYDFLYGDQEALNRPNIIVISEEVASKLFGTGNPIDQIISIEIPFGKLDYTVKGVFKRNLKSHLSANLILSIQNDDVGQWVSQQTSWAHNNIFHTYLRLIKETDLIAFEQKLPAFLERHAGEDFRATNSRKSLFLQPVLDIYLKSSIGNEISSNGNITYIYIFASIAAFLLLIGCINFMNLSTARSEKRAKEVGIRKVMGAEKKSLIFQFLGESILMCALALFLALTLVILCLPFFNAFTTKSLTLLQTPAIMYWIGGLALFTGLLSGIYPAFYLSSFKPATVLKGKLTNTISAAMIRKGLVVFQFAISGSLILVSVIIWQQLDFIKNQDLGFNKDQQIVFPFRNASTVENYTALKTEVLKNTKIVSATAGTTYPGFQLVQDLLFYAEGKTIEDQVDIRFAQGYDDYIETLGYEILYGSSLPSYSRDSSEAIVLNETAVRQLGYNLEEAVGRKIFYEVNQEKRGLEIVGVVKDFHYQSLHEPITPYGIVRLDQGRPTYFIANVRNGDFKNVVSDMEKAWAKVNPETPFEYSFMDEDFQRNYQSDQRSSDVILYFTLIAVFIACVGLFGLASFTTEQRRKEVGVRRVLGASVMGIIGLHLKGFLRLVMIAMLIASPLSYYLGNKWLQDFAFSINVSWQLFAVAGVLALFIAFITVSYQVIKTALTNPVNSLRSE